MQITFWGTRGSITVSGEEYIRYGGDTTCVEVRAASGEIIIIDAGSGLRRLGNKLAATGESEYHLVFTHAHWDHLSGFPFFKPIYRSSTRIHSYGWSFAQEFVQETISNAMRQPYFPVNFRDIKAQVDFFGVGFDPFSIGSVQLTAVPLSHPNGGIGFRLEEDGRSFVFLTDNELSFRHPTGLVVDDYVVFSRGADLLVHDAEFTPDEYAAKKAWGHSHFLEVVELALAAEVRHLGLTHHNQDRTDAQIDDIQAQCRAVIEARGGGVSCAAIGAGAVYDL